MRRRKILLGHVSVEKYPDGSTSFNEAVVSGLKPVADLHLLVTDYFGKQRTGPLLEETTVHGIPALVVRPRTGLAFDLTDAAFPSEGVSEGRYLADRIAEYASSQDIDLMHILQWGYLKGCLFEAALRARIPFVHTPYEYWSVCPQYFLLQYGRTTCSGPDESSRKCRDCMNHLQPLPLPRAPAPYPRPQETFRQKLPQRLEWRLERFLRSDFAMKLFGPDWEHLFGSTFGRQWDITFHLRALRHYLARAARILPMNTFWARELSEHLRVPLNKFTVCPAGVFEAVRKLPKGDRFELPLHFGHPHRVSRETGTFLVLDAWRTAAISREQGILHIYGQDGSTYLLREQGYDDLIRSGSVQIHEERIGDRLDEVFMPLAAVISAYTWKIGACGNIHAIARGIPTIAGRWDYPEFERESAVREGVNALTYRRWDMDSLAEVLRTCTHDPGRLERLYDRCELPPGFTHKDFIDRYLRVYEDVLSCNHDA